MQNIRPRRSVLYMPASNQRALDKAKNLNVDSLIFDLEDATAPDAKELAREQACNAVKSQSYGHREIAIRINGLDTQWGYADLKAAVEAKPDAILIPKVSSGAEVQKIEHKMQDFGAKDIQIWAMMETAKGIMNAAEIARSSGLLSCMVMGTNDLAKEMHLRSNRRREPLFTPLQMCILAARDANISAIDGVFNDLNDMQAFENECIQGLEFGFDGKTLIHPNQLEACNRIFAPTNEEVDLALRQIQAFELAQKEGKGIAVVDGRMVENLHIENAKRLVALAKSIENFSNEIEKTRKIA
jgi:citrate lyase subunit beta/citryl-CoA lyase